MIIQRFVVKRKEHLDALKVIVERTLQAQKATPKNTFQLILNYAKDLSSHLHSEMNELIYPLTLSNIPLIVKPALGAGDALMTALECCISPTSTESMMPVLMDADQYDVSDPALVETLHHLANAALEQEAILATGRRTKVSLSENHRLEILREIEEMFHALFMGKELKLLDQASTNVPKSYQTLGDPISGCYCFNIYHVKFFDLLSKLQRDYHRSQLYRYAGDPFVVMSASRFGPVVSMTVPTLDNPPSVFSWQDFSEKTLALKRCWLGDDYIAALKSMANTKTLEKFYTSEDIEEFKQKAFVFIQ